MYFHILIKRFSLKDLQCRINPTINLSSEFGVEWTTRAYGTEIPFIVIRTVPIPAGPVMIIPLIEIFLTFDLEGKIGLKAELSYSEEFSFGMAYENEELSNYGNVVEKETEESPVSFNQKVQVEGSFSIGVAPKVGFSIWEIISLDTRVYTKVKSGASLNFDLASPSFKPALYNSISSSKLFSQLELYMSGGIYLWGDRVLATTQSTTLEYPLWEAYFLPLIEDFVISNEMNKLEIEMDISNKLFFNATIGLNFYEKDEETREFTVKAGSMELCKYKKPPVGKEVFSLEMTKTAGLSPKVYEARVTVSLDAPGGPYTIESGVSTLFSIQDIAVTVITSKASGETIELMVDGFLYNGYPWVDLNNNGKKDEGEEITASGPVRYKVQSQTISVYGDVKGFTCNGGNLTSIKIINSDLLTELSCSGNQLTSIDLSNCKGLNRLSCSSNKLTTLDLSGCPALKSLSCSGNQLTVLDVSICKGLGSLSCWGNPLTSLDVSACKPMKFLTCHDCELTSLNVSGCKALEDLTCNNNPLTSLDVSGITTLEYLRCSYCQLSSLNISGCTKLKELNCSYNKLSSLDAINLTKLDRMFCNNNELTSLSVSGCIELTYLYCPENKLSSLDATNLTKLVELYCSGNQLTSLNVGGCTSLKKLYCNRNGLLGIRPAVFDDLERVNYDIRYKYKWGYDAKSETYKYIVEKDTEKGYWYAHEPDGGCHSPEPCNSK